MLNYNNWLKILVLIGNLLAPAFNAKILKLTLVEQISNKIEPPEIFAPL